MVSLKQAVKELGQRVDAPSPPRSPKKSMLTPTPTPKGSEALVASLDDLTPVVESPTLVEAEQRVNDLVLRDSTRPSLAALIESSADLSMPTPDEREDVLGRFANQSAPDSVAAETATVIGSNGQKEVGAVLSADVLSRFGEFLGQRMPEAIRHEIGHLLDQYTGTGSRDIQNRMVIARKLQRLGTEYGLSGLPKILVSADKEEIRDNPETLSEAERALLAELKGTVEGFSERPERAELILTREQRLTFFAYLRIFRLSGKGGVTEERKRLRMWDMITYRWPEYEESRSTPTAELIPTLFEKHGILSGSVNTALQRSNGAPNEHHDDPADLARALRGDSGAAKTNGHTDDLADPKVDAPTVTGSGSTTVDAGANVQITDAEVRSRLTAMETKLGEFEALHGTLERVTRQRDDAREEMGRLRLELGALKESSSLVVLEKTGAVERTHQLADTNRALAEQNAALTASAEEATAAATTATQRAETAEWESAERGRSLEQVTSERNTLQTTVNQLRERISQLELGSAQTANPSAAAGVLVPAELPLAMPRAEAVPVVERGAPATPVMTRTVASVNGHRLEVESNAGSVLIVPIIMNNNYNSGSTDK